MTNVSKPSELDAFRTFDKNLTWHQGLIPQDELWIKILGDHGGGTFKMGFQVLNVENPNSKTNTVVFSLFSAKDTRENLRTATSRFTTEIDELRGKQWRLPDGREMHSRVFAAGDYALLSMWYGISGATAWIACPCSIGIEGKQLEEDFKQYPEIYKYLCGWESDDCHHMWVRAGRMFPHGDHITTSLTERPYYFRLAVCKPVDFDFERFLTDVNEIVEESSESVAAYAELHGVYPSTCDNLKDDEDTDTASEGSMQEPSLP
ncbi:Hypp8396 [Branchiostoma lanceolatum]|uniref:Hypp8396 protein n=1 Tax=Branchiostoma lanceolatum TaxID=7740 RepID=A0A8K0EH82_BRALA|nr:Hypp8396 [Branchiostoma lanceolatum]